MVDTLRVGAPPMPSSGAARSTLLHMLPDTPGLQCWELGAGFGGLAVAIARARPGWSVVAWEAALVPFAVLRLRLALFGPRNVEARFGDVLAQSPEPADVLISYLLGDQMRGLEGWLGRRRRRWTLLSIHFSLRETPATDTQRAADAHRTPVFRYDGPARVAASPAPAEAPSTPASSLHGARAPRQRREQ